MSLDLSGQGLTCMLDEKLLSRFYALNRLDLSGNPNIGIECGLPPWTAAHGSRPFLAGTLATRQRSCCMRVCAPCRIALLLLVMPSIAEKLCNERKVFPCCLLLPMLSTPKVVRRS